MTGKRPIYGARALPALANRPDHQRLAAARITAGEYPVDTGTVIVATGCNIAASIKVSTTPAAGGG